jgi:hypothetical protein
MLLSDVVGAVAGLLLAIPPIKDQAGRLNERFHKRPGKTVVPGLRRRYAAILKEKRDDFSGYDTAFMALGSTGLIASFVIKIAGK